MLLRDYRVAPPLPAEEQIYLIGNPRFPAELGAQPVFPRAPGRLRRYIARKLRRPLLDLPSRDALLFIGHADRSWEDRPMLETIFQRISSRPRRRYAAAMGKSDLELGAELLARMPPNLVAAVGNNVSAPSPRLIYFPMGRDFRSRDAAATTRPNPAPDTLVYCNFSVDTHPDRKRVHDMLRDKTHFVRFDHMGGFMDYSLSREAFFARLASSKFAVCPRGNGLDTFRMWDCLALGVVPIVVKEAAFHAELHDLPILFLDHIEDFARLEPGRLEHIHEQMLNRDWNYEKIKLSHWFRHARSRLDALLPTLR